MTIERWMELYKKLQKNERIEIIVVNEVDVIFKQLDFLTQDDVTLIQEMNQIAKQAGMLLPTVYRQIFGWLTWQRTNRQGIGFSRLGEGVMIIQLNLRDKKDQELIKLALVASEKGALQQTLREYLLIGMRIKQMYGDDWQQALNGRPTWASEILNKLENMQVVKANGKSEEVSGDLGGLFDF